MSPISLDLAISEIICTSQPNTELGGGPQWKLIGAVRLFEEGIAVYELKDIFPLARC